ncbi:unnamed protein product [Arabidopsis halleri]
MRLLLKWRRRRKNGKTLTRRPSRHILAIQEYGKSRRGDAGEEKISLQRLNGLAQDGLSLQFNLDLLAPQVPSDHHVQSTLETWKNQCHSLRVNLTSANLQAKDNMRKAAQEEAFTAADGVGDDVVPLGQQFDGNTVPTVNIPLQQRMHDEL